jgi:hypothetical protein
VRGVGASHGKAAAEVRVMYSIDAPKNTDCYQERVVFLENKVQLHVIDVNLYISYMTLRNNYNINAQQRLELFT